jgi:hypothetical protein
MAGRRGVSGLWLNRKVMISPAISASTAESQ